MHKFSILLLLLFLLERYNVITTLSSTSGMKARADMLMSHQAGVTGAALSCGPVQNPTPPNMRPQAN